MRLARHRQFGSSSEKTEYDAEQLSLFDEAKVFADEKEPEMEVAEIQKYYRKARRQNRDRLPADLPVEIVEHTLPDNQQDCPACGNKLHVMGKEIREELKLIPAKATIIRHYSCRTCEKEATEVPIVKATMPAPVMKGSFASPEAVAHIITQKFVMSTPLYRQAHWLPGQQYGVLREGTRLETAGN